MQSVSSSIWTRVAVIISYDDNHYITGTSEYLQIYPWFYQLRKSLFLKFYFKDPNISYFCTEQIYVTILF